jgi:hypothetical protein
MFFTAAQGTRDDFYHPSFCCSMIPLVCPRLLKEGTLMFAFGTLTVRYRTIQTKDALQAVKNQRLMNWSGH